MDTNSTQASVAFDGLPKTCPIVSSPLVKLVTHLGRQLEVAPFTTNVSSLRLCIYMFYIVINFCHIQNEEINFYFGVYQFTLNKTVFMNLFLHCSLLAAFNYKYLSRTCCSQFLSRHVSEVSDNTFSIENYSLLYFLYL